MSANGDNATSNVNKIIKITVDPTIIPTGFGLSLEQPAWDPTTKRFYTSIPIIANNPTGCNYGQLAGPITCHGGLLVTDPLQSDGGAGRIRSDHKYRRRSASRLLAKRRHGWTA